VTVAFAETNNFPAHKCSRLASFPASAVLLLAVGDEGGFALRVARLAVVKHELSKPPLCLKLIDGGDF